MNETQKLDSERSVKVKYVNFRGETSMRTIIPLRLWFGSTEWHPDPQWLLDVFDIEKNAERTYALTGILSWNLKA